MLVDSSRHTITTEWQNIKLTSRLTSTFYKRSRWLFIFVVLTRAISLLMQRLTVFIPLKIIILASYEAPPIWVVETIGLANNKEVISTFIIAFLFVYSLYLYLSALHQRLLSADSLSQFNREDLIFDGNKISTAKMKKLYTRTVSITSDELIIFLGLISIGLVSLPLMILTFLVLILFYFFTVKLSNFLNVDARPNITKKQLVEYLASTAFVLLFLGLCVGVLELHLNVFIAVYVLVMGRTILDASRRTMVAIPLVQGSIGNKSSSGAKI